MAPKFRPQTHLDRHCRKGHTRSWICQPSYTRETTSTPHLFLARRTELRSSGRAAQGEGATGGNAVRRSQAARSHAFTAGNRRGRCCASAGRVRRECRPPLRRSQGRSARGDLVGREKAASTTVPGRCCASAGHVRRERRPPLRRSRRRSTQGDLVRREKATSTTVPLLCSSPSCLPSARRCAIPHQHEGNCGNCWIEAG